MEFAITSETIRAALTVMILIGAVYGFVSERIPPDVTLLLALLALLLIGVLTPGEAFFGFSHPATVSVAAVLVLSAAIERTGVLNLLTRRLMTIGHSELLFTAVIMLLIGVISAFTDNTAAVAIFIPVVSKYAAAAGSALGAS